MPAPGNLLETFLEATALHREKPFLLPPDAPEISYGEMFDRAGALARSLAECGVGPGDRVLVRISKSPDAVAAYLGCLHAGAIHVPVNPRCTADELRHFVTDADPAVVVVDHAETDVVSDAGPTTIDIHDLVQATAGDRETGDPTPLRGDDIAALLYTSGTTGRPKGAALTHDNLRHNARALHDTWRFTQEDHLLHTLPVFHVHGLFVALHCALLAATPVTFLPRFDVDAVIAALPRTTVFMGVPTYYRRLLDDDRLDAALTAGVRLFTSGSAPLPDTVFDTFTERTAHRICERYGMSEAGIITSNPIDGDRVAGTVGFALAGVELRVHTDGNPAAVDEAGSVEIRGPHLFSGYWRRPEATAAAHAEDGWFITGDIGSVDADGRLSLQGRSGDMIISGGENIYPKEIELVLDTVPGIVESAIIGLPHPDLGEAVTAIVVVTDAHRPDELRRSLDHAVARYKHPKAVISVDELPRNTMGKVQKSLLRATYSELYSGGD